MRKYLFGFGAGLLIMICLLNVFYSPALCIAVEDGKPLAQGVQKADPVEKDGAKAMSKSWVALSIAFLLVVVLMFGAYMFYLQRQFLTACREDNQLAMFYDKPAGLPSGTVRSILTLLIIIFSLYLFILSTANVGQFPQALGAILSAIIGFYFGNRSTSNKEETLTRHLKTQLDDAQAGKDQGKAGQVVGKIAKNVKLLKTVMALLPGESKNKYKPLLDKLEKGANVAKDLVGAGAFTDAVKKADDLYKTFKKENPLKGMVVKASASFATVAAGIPPLAIVGAVVGVGGVLAGVAYSRWKARILNMPFSPAVAPLKPVDADTCFFLMMQSPVLKKGFQTQLKARDGVFLEKAMTDFFVLETEALWETYSRGNGFESFDDFEKGVQQFRMSAATTEIENEVDPALFAEVGGYKKFMEAVDKIRKDETASADLDMLMEAVDGLKKIDEPLVSIFGKVRKEVEAS